MILPKELQQLQEERSKIEGDVSLLKEQQKKLEEKAKELELKIMEELNSKNDETRDNISHLESMISDLEQKLRQTTQKPGQDEPKEETTAETSNSEVAFVTAEMNHEVLEGSLQEYVAAPVSPDDFSEASEEADSELRHVEEKKKRKFF